MRFRARVVPAGNATAVEVPAEVMEALGPQARPLVTVTISDHSWRSRVALMRGRRLIGISAANRAGAGIAEGDLVDVDLELDEAPREAAEPPDLAEALDRTPKARVAFDRMPFGLKRKHVANVEDAKSPEVRRRRIGKLVAILISASR